MEEVIDCLCCEMLVHEPYEHLFAQCLAANKLWIGFVAAAGIQGLFIHLQMVDYQGLF